MKTKKSSGIGRKILSSIMVVFILGFIGLLAIPPSFYSSTNITDITTSTLTDEELIAETTLGFLQNSVISDITYNESDQSLIQQWLDETNNPLGTEKFGIETQVQLFDSDQNISTDSSILTVPLASITDEQGNLLDLGSIKVTMQGLTKDIESSTNIWGKVQFYIDDDIVSGGDNFFWASETNTKRLDLTITNSLSFIDSEPSDTSSSVKRALPPSFSDQSKKHFTYSKLTDDGRTWIDKTDHYFRIVVSEIHANVDSPGNFKEFNWSGQHIAYELKITVNADKKVVLQEDIDGKLKAIEIFKSDNTLKLCGQNIYQNPQNHNPINDFAQPPNVIVKDLDGNIILEASYTHVAPYGSSSSSCTTFTGIPRSSNLLFEIGSVDYPVTTGNTQENHIVSASLQHTSSVTIKCPFDVNRNCGGFSNFKVIQSSSFGYGGII